jgi:hypothetical protein
MPPTYTTGTTRAYQNEAEDRPLPPVTLDYLANPVSEGFRDNALFNASCQFRDAGYSQAEAEAQLIRCGSRDGFTEAYSKRKIASAYSRGPRDPIANGTFSGDTAPSAGAGKRGKKAKEDGSAITPELLPKPIADGARKLIEHCFSDEERVCVCVASLKQDGELDLRGGKTKRRKQLLEELQTKSIEEIYPGKNGVFVRINPMTMNGKADKDVASHRFVLVEFDEDRNGNAIPKEVQFAILKNSGFPIAAIVDSGNISLQAWLRVDASDGKEHAERAKVVVEYFSRFDGYDLSTKNPSRYCRLPGITRNLYKGGKLIGTARQQLLSFGLGPASWSEYEKRNQVTEEECREHDAEVMQRLVARDRPFSADGCCSFLWTSRPDRSYHRTLQRTLPGSFARSFPDRIR